MNNKMRLLGIVITYYPNIEETKRNIETYIQYVEKLIIWENTPLDDRSKFKISIPEYENKILYMGEQENLFIAYPLNCAIKFGQENEFTHLLTMDQDSKFLNNSLVDMINWINKNNNGNNIGIISPYHLMDKNFHENLSKKSIVDATTVMTSGNILYLASCLKVGGFIEKYLIDYVDHEYCLRLRKNGFSVKVMMNCILIHKLGNTEAKQILFHKISFTNHNYIRRYFITRNRLDIASKYLFSFPIFVLKDLRNFIKEWIKIILFEDDKIKKNKAILLGIKDFLLHKYGEYRY
jgi:rhamnosyltransferase